jgi:pimeloyl-ACP methyl ester carboxylesterase
MSADTAPTLVIDGYQVRYAVAGRDNLPPVILVHGWGGFKGVWKQTVQALETSFHCVAVDLLGFGGSDKPPKADYGIPAQGRRILQIADQLGLDRFALIGHSMGGQIALYTAAMLAPERLTKVVSVSGVVTGKLSPFVERSIYSQIALARHLPGLHWIGRRLNGYRWYADRQFKPWFHRMDAIPFEDWAIDREMFNQPGIAVSLYKAGQAIHQTNLTPYLDRIQAETLILFGQQDGTVPVSDAHLAARQIPNNHLVLIDECGHFPMYEQPRQYRQALLAFLCN